MAEHWNQPQIDYSKLSLDELDQLISDPKMSAIIQHLVTRIRDLERDGERLQGDVNTLWREKADKPND